MDSAPRAGWELRLLAALPLLLVLAFRGVGPEDLDDNDQAKQALYVLDIYQNGNWILPELRGTSPATKPPLYAWLATGSSAVLGGPSAFACRLPSAIASLLLVLLVFQLGSERFGTRAGLYAAWILACSHTLINLAVHVRPDAVLALLVTCALFALHRAELGDRRAAPLFWISLSLSVLAKGPVGLFIALGGVLALAISAQGRARLSPLLRSGWAAVMVVPPLWLLAAYLVGGSPYIRETVLGETVDRVLASGTRAGKATTLGTLFAEFAATLLPWSIFALLGVARVWKRAGRERHPLLVLPVGGFAVGLLLLNLSRGQRSDYLLPLLPAASLVTAALLVDPPDAIRRIWRIELACGGVVALLAGALAVVHPPSVLPALARFGAGWGSAVLLAGGVLLAVARTRKPLRGSTFLCAILALLALHAAYNAVLSPVAVLAREPDVRRFVAAVRGAARPQDRLEVLNGVLNSVFFLLGSNRPALTLPEVSAYDPWAPPEGRLLLVASEREQSLLAERWPGRFCALVQQEFTDSSGGLALLEDSAVRREVEVDQRPQCPPPFRAEPDRSALR